MINKYYSKNRYFKDEIKEYFIKNGWININKLNDNKIYYDVDYFDKICKDCEVVNQLEDINYLGNKKLQYENIINFYKKKPNYVPLTIAFTKSNINNIKNSFKSNFYILKPENASFRSGIQVINSFDQAYNWVNNNKYENWIMQEYIKDPLLYNNRKFHLRIYSILKIDKLKMVTYVYYYGFMYSAKNEYKLTINSDSALSGEGSEEQVNLFPQDFIKKFSFNKYEYVKKQINYIIKDTILAASHSLKCPNRENSKYKCFKLLGYDLLVDSKFNVKLLEINARFITFKYPPENYKKKMYFNILDLIFKDDMTNFDKVNTIFFNNNLIENFDNKVEFNNSENFLLFYIKLISFLIIVILLFIIDN